MVTFCEKLHKPHLPTLTDGYYHTTVESLVRKEGNMALIPALLATYIYFASGASRVGDIRGFHQAGIDVGTAAPEVLSKREGVVLDAERELISLAGTGRRVFVDSGAFSEIEFGENGPFVADAITDAEWDRRLGLYERLSEALSDQLYIVAPDKVAFQWETLDRLEAYAERIRRCRDNGANIIVAHQKGALSLTEFHANAVEFLGFDDFICAFPMAKDATSIDDIAEFCANVKPERVHLLGIGPKSRGSKFSLTLLAIQYNSPETVVFCDSVAIAGVAGRDNGGRPYTKKFDETCEEARVASWGEGIEGVGDYTNDVIEDIESWLPVSHRLPLIKELSALLGIEAPRGTSGRLHGWLTDDRDEFDGESISCNDWASHVIDGYWAKYAHKASTVWRKSEAVTRYFGSEAGDILRAN